MSVLPKQATAELDANLQVRKCFRKALLSDRHLDHEFVHDLQHAQTLVLPTNSMLLSYQTSCESACLVKADDVTAGCQLASFRALELNALLGKPACRTPTNHQHDCRGPNWGSMAAHVQECVDNVTGCLMVVVCSCSIGGKHQQGEDESIAKELEQVLHQQQHVQECVDDGSIGNQAHRVESILQAGSNA